MEAVTTTAIIPFPATLVTVKRDSSYLAMGEIAWVSGNSKLGRLVYLIDFRERQFTKLLFWSYFNQLKAFTGGVL